MRGRIFAKNENNVRIGIDIGGTFTDLVVVNLVNMEMHAAKVPSTPPKLLSGIEDGLNEIMQSLNIDINPRLAVRDQQPSYSHSSARSPRLP